MKLADHDIGGAVVRRTFSISGRRVRGGENLSRSEVLSMPSVNRNALIETGYMDVFPVTAQLNAMTAPLSDAERHVVHVGRGQFDVIIGHKLNDKPLSKEEAEELATRPS